MRGVGMKRRGSWSVVGGGSLGAEEEKAGRFRVKVSVSVNASVCWLLAGFGLLGEEGGLQSRAGLDWTGLDRTGQGGWMGVWMGGWGGRQFLGRWAADRVGCKGGYGGTRGAKPGIH